MLLDEPDWTGQFYVEPWSWTCRTFRELAAPAPAPRCKRFVCGGLFASVSAIPAFGPSGCPTQ